MAKRGRPPIGDNKQNKITIMKHYLTLKQLDPQSTEFYKHQNFLENSLNINWDSFYSIHSKLKGNSVSYFKEKSRMDEGWINGGFFVLSQKKINSPNVLGKRRNRSSLVWWQLPATFPCQ